MLIAEFFTPCRNGQRFDSSLSHMAQIDNNTRISDLTVGQLLEIINSALKPSGPETVSGLEGIAEIFGVSISTAKRIKASGIINDAISQQGRIIVTDRQRALDLYAKATHGRTYKTR